MRLTTIAATLILGTALTAAATDDIFTKDFGIENKQFKPDGENPLFPISAGKFWKYEGQEDGEHVVLQIKTLDQTQVITFTIKGKQKVVTTRVIEEREWHDDTLVEVSRNFFASDMRGNVFYFGEDVDIYEGGKIVSHDGSWRSGLKGALPGLFMPELFLLGSRYQQETAPNVAMDRAENTNMGFKVKTPAGTFINCVKTVETTPLEPGAQEAKFYAPGVGLIVDGVLKLVEFH